ncbi:glycosyltransferase family 92 protein [Puniceicoccaceae bacterium K14]|nr:glycosyltransferase family 92 protein [Puniceicoccaceae bacterium K14]
MEDLGVCLIFKDSAKYLEEWLLFHYVQGARKFYLYDNESQDNWRSIVQPWVKLGLVDAVTYPGYYVQQEAYCECLEKAKGEVKWLAFIDDDEFFYPEVREPLISVLNEYECHAGVAVSWILYGSGGAKEYQNEWVIKRFTNCLENPDPHVKCIVRPERVTRSICVGHMFETVGGYDIVDENYRPLTEAMNPTPTTSKLRINHYLVKSWDEWEERRNPTLAGERYVNPIPKPEWQKSDLVWSRAKDWTVLRYLEEMENARRELLDREF